MINLFFKFIDLKLIKNMETVYLLERKIISLHFNTLKDTIFILANNNSSSADNSLELTEEDLVKNTLLKRYQLLTLSECNIINPSYRHLPNNTFEGYGLYFYEDVNISPWINHN